MNGTILREARQARGLSQSAVSRATGVDQGALSRAERGLAGLSLPALCRVAGAVGLDGLARELRPFIAEPGGRAVADASERGGASSGAPSSISDQAPSLHPDEGSDRDDSAS
jgi:transcriptional regulator with XRE-family HTH domain